MKKKKKKRHLPYQWTPLVQSIFERNPNKASKLDYLKTWSGFNDMISNRKQTFHSFHRKAWILENLRLQRKPFFGLGIDKAPIIRVCGFAWRPTVQLFLFLFFIFCLSIWRFCSVNFLFLLGHKGFPRVAQTQKWVL